MRHGPPMDRPRMTIDPPDGLQGANASPVMRARARGHEAMAWLMPRLSWHRAALGLFILLAIIVVATFADYGVTWDEDVHNWYGVFVLDYYLTLFKDGRCLNWLNLYYYGAAFDTIAAALNHFAPFGTYETRHLLNG